MRFLRTLLYVFILSCGYGYCQPQVICCDTSIIKKTLFGDGLEISHFKMTDSICKYSGLTGFDLGDSGVILSTGSPKRALSDSQTGNPMSYSSPNDTIQIAVDIAELYKDTVAIHDAAIIEFDFKLTGGCDGIFFNYVFASEEYTGYPLDENKGYVCSQFNDKFAFYIAKGEKEIGKILNYKNIATIPGTNASVEINSINNGSCGDGYQPDTIPDYTNLYTEKYNNIAFNGSTVPLSASVKLSPDSTYHAYIIVADFSDNAFDSGVFFKGKGIFGRKCPTISVQCENGISTLKVENESNNGTIISYQWLKNGQPIVGGTGDTYIAQDDSIYSVNITYEDGSFINVIAPGKRCCPTGGITINGDVTEGSLSVCKDKVLDIGYTNSNQMTNPQYQWTFTDVSETYTSPNFSITAEKTGTLKLKVTSEECANTIELTTEIHVDLCVGTVCNDCPSRFSPTPGEKYTLSGWVSAEDQIGDKDSFEKVYILLVFNLIGSDTPDSVKCYPDGNIIDGWQRISKNFVIPQNAEKMRIALKNESSDNRVYFDDIRFHPFNASVKSYVYDPKTLRLAAELDDENYATFYEYDEEGALVRIKKETERGVMTIREARQSKPKNLGNGN